MSLKLITCLLFCQMCLSLFYCEPLHIIAEDGKSVSLPCNLHNEKNFIWLRNNSMLLNYRNGNMFYKGPSVGCCKVPLLHMKNISLLVKDVQLSYAGLYSCSVEDKSESIQLSVFKIVTSATSLFPGDTLTLSLESSPKDIAGLHVWREGPNGAREEVKMGEKLEVRNVNVRHSGTYKYHVKLPSNEATFVQDIFVAGFSSSPRVIYVSEAASVLIPWVFNFNVKKAHLRPDIKVIKGAVSYSPESAAPFSNLSELRVSESAVCWPGSCHETPHNLRDLSFLCPEPKSGRYRMEILLKMAGREHTLQKEVCLADLTVKAIPSNMVSPDAITILHCDVNCHSSNGTLQWKHWNKEDEAKGQWSVSKEVSGQEENIGVWTCILTDGRTMISANLTLELPSDSVMSSLFWVTVGGGAILLLVCIVTTALWTAKCHRKRRARRRAWLIQSLHQHNTCECKRLPPTEMKGKHCRVLLQ